jgi:hypothetical protein
MTQKFIFQGQTTFVDKPRDTVIQNFQNIYIAGDGSDSDKINAEILKLVELVLQSKDLPVNTKDEAAQALHSVAGELTLKGTLQAVKEVVSKAADIAAPALGIITTILKLLGLG